MRHMEEVFIVVSPVSSRSIAHRLGAIFVIGSSPGTARRQTSRQRRNYFNQFETELKVRSARRYGVAP